MPCSRNRPMQTIGQPCHSASAGSPVSETAKRQLLMTRRQGRALEAVGPSLRDECGCLAVAQEILYQCVWFTAQTNWHLPAKRLTC